MKDMKRLLILLMATLFLVACGNKDESEPNAEETEEVFEESEVIYDRTHDITLVDSENINIKLIKSRKESLKDYGDWMKLMFVVTNKQERTYDFYFDEIQLDKDVYELETLAPTSTNIGPGEKQELMVMIEIEDEIQFDEYIAGMFVHFDYEKNVHEENFSEYIIEQ